MIVAARLQEPDQVPVYLTYQANYLYPVDRKKYGIMLVYFFPDILYHEMKSLWRRHKGQCDICAEFGVIVEASAFGGRIRWPSDTSENHILFHQLNPLKMSKTLMRLIHLGMDLWVQHLKSIDS
jgi:hypothetical protein